MNLNRMMKVLLSSFVLITAVSAVAQTEVHQCDILAAYPGNKDNPAGVSGVSFEMIEAEKAIEACKKALETSPDSPRYQFQLGRAYDAGKQFYLAIRWYKKSVAQNYAPAQFHLGVMYKEGVGVVQSDETALKWYQKAAEQGYAPAQSDLGLMYEDGIAVSQSNETALKWYRKAADQGYALAQFNVGWMYRKGKGVPQSDEMAVEWYRKAAEQGNAHAQNNLGNMYARGLGVNKDEEKAVELYIKSAKQGELFAMRNLCDHYRPGGTGAVSDIDKAMYWCRQAIELEKRMRKCGL